MQGVVAASRSLEAFQLLSASYLVTYILYTSAVNCKNSDMMTCYLALWKLVMARSPLQIGIAGWRLALRQPLGSPQNTTNANRASPSRQE